MLDYLIKFGTNKIMGDPYIEGGSYRATQDMDIFEWKDANYDTHAHFRGKKIVGQFTTLPLTLTQFDTLMTMYESAIVSGDDGQEKVSITAYVPRLRQYKTFDARFDRIDPVIRKSTGNVETYEPLMLKFYEY